MPFAAKRGARHIGSVAKNSSYLWGYILCRPVALLQHEACRPKHSSDVQPTNLTQIPQDDKGISGVWLLPNQIPHGASTTGVTGHTDGRGPWGGGSGGCLAQGLVYIYTAHLWMLSACGHTARVGLGVDQARVLLPRLLCERRAPSASETLTAGGRPDETAVCRRLVV